jgi:hypothetical protein
MLPTPLLTAISADHGGQVVLVLGAGCSKESPTSLPLARECAEEAHRRLVADGVLAAGDCTDPTDLSLLAERVFEKTGSQAALVERMSPMKFRQALVNEGYRMTAALLREHAIAAVLTLNFDLAIFHAISSVGGATDVAVILGPEDHAHLQLINVVYIHRSAKADPDQWILRTSEIEEGWHGRWEQVVAQRFLANPVTVFVGLGSPARVLIETAGLIRHAIPEGANIYQVDVVNRIDSAFFAELRLPNAAFSEMKWGDFVEELAARLLEEHRAQLQIACEWLVGHQGVPNEDIAGLCRRMVALGLLDFGSLRANWLLEEGPYLPWRKTDPRLVADLLLAVGFIERQAEARAFFDRDGIVEFRSGATILGRFVFASGKGSKRWFAMEAELQSSKRRWGLRQPQPTAAVFAGVAGERPTPASPVDITGETQVGDIAASEGAITMVSVDDLRNTENLSRVLLNVP